MAWPKALGVARLDDGRDLAGIGMVWIRKPRTRTYEPQLEREAAMTQTRIDPSPEMPPSDRPPQALHEVPLEALRAQLTIVEDRLGSELASGGYRPLPGRTARIARLRRREYQLRRAIERKKVDPPPDPAQLGRSTDDDESRNDSLRFELDAT